MYGFNGRSEFFPSQLMVDITEVCNLGCIHCPHPSFKVSDIILKIDVNLNKKAVDEVNHYGKNITKYIRYTSNGEPLVHPKSYEMIQYAVDHSNTKLFHDKWNFIKRKKMIKLYHGINLFRREHRCF